MCFFQVELVDDLGEESSSTLDSLDMDDINQVAVYTWTI